MGQSSGGLWSALSESTDRCYVIGLIGNIATGKSQVAQMLARRGAEHVDADRLAHQAMARGTPVWQQIVDGPVDNLLGAVTEDPLGTRVEDYDGEIFVGGDYCVIGAFDQS